MKTALLPILAVTLAFFGITYTACQESKADEKATGAAVEIREEIAQYQSLLNELKQIQQSNVVAYGQDMGVTSSSQGLEQINKQNELLEKNRLRLEYHRLQLIQADTTNATRNENQLKELSKDIATLKTEGELIRAGIDPVINTRVTK